MKYCVKCGNKLKDNSNFCSKCGTKITLSKKENNEEKKEKLLLTIGALLIIVSSIIFAFANWNEMTSILKVLFLSIESLFTKYLETTGKPNLMHKSLKLPLSSRKSHCAFVQ